MILYYEIVILFLRYLIYNVLQNVLLYASDSCLHALGADVCHCGHLVEGLPDALVDDERDPYNKSQDGDD